MQYTHQKGSVGLIIILALALILGAVFILRSRPSALPADNSVAVVSQSSPIPLKQVPFYPNLTWSQSSTPAVSLTTASGNLPLSGTFSSATREDTDETLSLESIGEFENFYDAELTSNGWVRDEITLNGTSISGPISETTEGSTWSYLKVHNNSIYTVVLSTESSGNPSPDGEYEHICPCSTVFTLFVGNPIPVSNI
jgi:hypothetical protein